MLKTIARKLDPAPDAVSLLEADHRQVDALFAQFEDGNGRARTTAVEQICKALEIHAKIEEKIFYPQAKKVVRDEINEGIVEHETLKRLVGELQRMNASDEFFEPREGAQGIREAPRARGRDQRVPGGGGERARSESDRRAVAGREGASAERRVIARAGAIACEDGAIDSRQGGAALERAR